VPDTNEELVFLCFQSAQFTAKPTLPFTASYSRISISFVNHELSGPLLFDTFLGSIDSFLLRGKGFGGLAFLLYRHTLFLELGLHSFLAWAHAEGHTMKTRVIA
jgi:hypothetical protein